MYKRQKEITIPAYKVVSVFDVSQTEGKELPDIAVDELTGDVDRYKDFFAALIKMQQMIYYLLLLPKLFLS